MTGKKESDLTCLNNTQNCKAMCCKMVGVGITDRSQTNNNTFFFDNYNESMLHYYRIHEGISVMERGDKAVIRFGDNVKRKVVKKNGQLYILFNARCEHLTEDLMCGLYGKPERPKVCREGYNKQKTGVMFCPDCIYEPVPNSPILTWNEIDGFD